MFSGLYDSVMKKPCSPTSPAAEQGKVFRELIQLQYLATLTERVWTQFIRVWRLQMSSLFGANSFSKKSSSMILVWKKNLILYAKE